MKKFLCSILCLFILPFGFACTDSDGLTTVRLNEVTHSIFYAPLYIAIEGGFFEEEGLKIELTNGGGANNSMAALISGSADIAFCGPEAAIYVINGGTTNSPKVFGQLTKRDGSFLVGREPDDNFDWSHLNGKTVIAGRTGGVPAMTFQYVVNNHGLYNGQNITLDNSIEFNLMGPTFEGGYGDYVTLFEPTATEFEQAGLGHVLASVGAESGDVPYTTFIALTSYISRHRDILVKFMTALQKAIKYLDETDKAVVAETIEGQFPDTGVKSIQIALESYLDIDAWMHDMSMTEDSLERLQNIITNAGELNKRVTLGELVDNSIAREVYDSIMK